MSSRFVASTLNGMFIAQLAAGMTAPSGSATVEHGPAVTSHPALLSRANDDPAPSLDDAWEVVIPVSPNVPHPGSASGPRPTANRSRVD